MRYETWVRLDSGRYYFVGWYQMTNEEYVVATEKRGKYLYKTYQWLNGDIEKLRYTIG